MINSTIYRRSAAFFLISSFFVFSLSARAADSAIQIDRDVNASLQKLFEDTPVSQDLYKTAKGVLVFPSIVKGGFIVGGQYGTGALRKNGKTAGYYESAAASYGLQAGVQSFGYVLFFMTEDSLSYLSKTSGWEIGVGPSVVVVDTGVAKSLTTSTARSDIYAFIFGQKGLMAGVGLQGSKITRIYPKK